MTLVRDQAGKVTDVAAGQAENLVRTGYYQYVSTPVRPRQGGSFGYSAQPGIDSGTSLTDAAQAVQSGIGTIANWEWMRWTKSASEFVTRNLSLPDDLFGFFPGDDRIFGGGLGNFEEYLAQQDTAGERQPMTDAEKAAADKYISGSFGDDSEPMFDENGNMIYGGAASWWNIVPQFDDDGNPVMLDGEQVVQRIKAKGGEWNIENDSEMKGFTDQQMEYISDQYTNMAFDPHQEGTPAFSGAGARPTLGGGGRGGGGGGPKYVKPMREATEDGVKAMLTALTGSEDESLVQKYADMFEVAHKQGWDVARSGGTNVDPTQTVLEAIRGQEDYKRIHKLRPESESETKWIGNRSARLTQLGVTPQDADDRAIWLAQSGTNLADIDTGAFQTSRGRKDISLLNNIGKAASQVARRI